MHESFPDRMCHCDGRAGLAHSANAAAFHYRMSLHIAARPSLCALPASYGLVVEPLELPEPVEPLELPELGVLDELDEPPAAPGVDELPEPAVPEVLPDALPLPDASELGLEPEVPDGGVLGVLEPAAPEVALSLDPEGGVVPEVDPEPVPLVEPLAAGVEEDDASSPPFLQPVAATLSNAARNSTFDV